MKILLKNLSAWLPLFLVLSTAGMPAARAEDEAWKKAGRGFNNFLLGYYEIIQQSRGMAKTERWPIAIGGGLFKGLYRGTLRTVAGVVEMVTFPLPIPWGYAPLIQPEHVIEPVYQTPNRWPDWGVK